MNGQARSVFVGLLFWISFVVIMYYCLFNNSNVKHVNGSLRSNGITMDIGIWPNNQWDSHFYIFVGGTHGSGTTVTERLLSSQPFASGLQINDHIVSDTRSCMYISGSFEKSCVSPENEGLFVTREFQKIYVKKETNCKAYTATYWGECAHFQHLTEKDIFYEPSQNPQIIRSRLFNDWKQFWELNVPFLVEKDIPNLVRSRFLQELFGMQRTAFVFILRHPMATCKRFSCDIRRHVEAWLTAYSLMEIDLVKLNHYIVLHMEGYTQQPQIVISALETFLNWKKISYQIRNKTGSSDMDSQSTKKIRSKEKPPRQAIMNTNYEEAFSANPAPSHKPMLRLRRFINNRKSGLKGHRSTIAPGRGLREGRGRRQLLGFHGDEKAIHKGKKLNQSEVVSLSRSVATMGWEATYATYLRTNATIRETLLPYERRLRRFCYTIHTLQPVCSSYVWKRSKRTLARVRILNSSEHRAAEQLAEQSRLVDIEILQRPGSLQVLKRQGEGLIDV